MRALLLVIGLLTIFLTCYKIAALDRVDVDASEPGKVCEVHNIPLQSGVVPIDYGLIRLTTEEIEAHQKLFPLARSSYHDGCVVKEAKWARVSFCPECRKAEAIWKQAQERKLAPILAYLERVREVVQNKREFEDVHPYVRRESGPTVGIEGRVKSEEDLAELKHAVEAANPPKPVYWTVRVVP